MDKIIANDRPPYILLPVVGAVTLLSWLLAAEMLPPSSELLAWVKTIAYPASVILGAGSLALGAQRAPFLKNSRDAVSLVRTGIILLGVLTLVVLTCRNVTLVQNFCLYCSLTSVLAYVFLIIQRSS